MFDKWCLEQALKAARNSIDPNTRVGALIVGAAGVMALGFNHFPTGVRASLGRLQDRDTKLRYMVHGEMAALLTALAGLGAGVIGGTLYLAAIDAETGEKWGGAPCENCTKHLIQAGIKRIVTLPMKNASSRWKEEIERSQATLKEAGVSLEVMEL